MDPRLAARDTTATARPAGPERASRRLHGAFLVGLSVVIVFVAQFRPWQGGLLEEWGLALAWDQEGWPGFTARLSSTIGRPLALAPYYVGLWLSGGGFVGMYLMLALVAVGQLVAIGWGLRPVISHAAVRWSLGLLLALHPWWAAGDVLRFLPAQVAVLGFAVWFCAAARYLTGRSRWWLLVMIGAPTAGLLSYQGPAGSLLVAAVLFSVRIGGLRGRSLITILSAVLTVTGVLTWSVVIAPRLVVTSYEESLLTNGLDPAASVRAVVRTLSGDGSSVIVLAALVATLVVTLALRGDLPRREGLLLLVGILAAPLTALIYSAQPLHLQDPERLVLPVGASLFAVLASSLAMTPAGTTAARVFAAVVAVASIAAAAMAYASWGQLGAAQQGLIDQAADARLAVDPGNTLVLVDRTGRYGDVYTLLPPHLQVALDLEYGPGAPVELCTPDDTVRDQPDAARLGIVSTPSCTDVLTPGFELIAPLQTPFGLVDAYQTAPAAPVAPAAP